MKTELQARMASRMREVRKHLKDMATAVANNDPIAARLAGIRLEVWAGACKDVAGEEVEKYLASVRKS